MDQKQTYKELEQKVKALENSLKEIKEQNYVWDIILDQFPDMLCFIGFDRKFKKVNAAWQKTLGWSEKELLDTQYDDFIFPEDKERSINTGKEAKKRGNSVNEFINRYRCKDGSYRWLSWSAIPLHDKLITFGIARDISKQKQAEEAISQLAQEWQRTFDSSNDAIFILDKIHRILRINKTAEKFFQRPSEDLLGKHCWEIVHGTKQPIPECPVFRVEKNLRRESIEIQMDSRWFQVTVDPILNAAGMYDGGVHIIRDITDQKKTEDNLNKVIQQLAASMNNSPLAFLECDAKLRVIRYSKEAEKIFGWASGEVLGKNITELNWVHEDDREYVERETAGLFSGEQKRIKIVNRNYRKDGSIILCEWYNSGIYDQNGKLISIVAQVLDVTDRIKAESELQKERDTAQKYLDIAGVIFVAINRKGEVTLINQKGCEILGYDEKEIIGKNWFDNFIPDWLKEDLIPVSEKLLNGHLEAVEYHENPILTKTGEERMIAWHNTILKDDVGNIIGHLSSGEDITNRKKAEEALLRSEKQYRLVMENLDEVVFLTDLEGKLTYVSPPVERILGYTPDELIGLTSEDIIDPTDWERRRRRIEDAFHNLDSTLPDNYRVRTKNGEYRWLSVSGGPVYEGENVVGLLGVISDMTQQKQAEEESERLHAQLLQVHKMEAIGTLAGGIAHEFNNILGIIIGNNEIAIDHIPEWSPARECIEEIRTASIRAKDVVRQILSFARKSHMERKLVEISPIIEDTLRLLRSSIPKIIDIHYETECKQDTVLADPTHINQILMNLCANASQAMSEDGGLITLNLQNVELKNKNKELNLESGNYVKLIVKDTGQGIDPEIMDRIFDPYFTTKGLAEGTGMGLAVVHGIVQSYEGAITVKSEPGKGSVFEVFFPCIEGEVLKEIEKEEELPTGDECILFVDDEEGLVRAYTRGLESLGYDVVSFSNPLEALEAFQKDPERYDLIITDLAMPKLNGDKMVKEMMGIRSGIPVILCTGYSERISEKEAEAMDINAFLLKPLIKKDLAITVRNVLDEATDTTQQ